MACSLEKIHDANFSISSSFRELEAVVLIRFPDPFLTVPAHSSFRQESFGVVASLCRSLSSLLSNSLSLLLSGSSLLSQSSAKYHLPVSPSLLSTCGFEEDQKEGFLYQVFYFCNPTCFKPAGKAADTIARRSKSSRQLKQKFSHTRKTPKNEAVDK